MPLLGKPLDLITASEITRLKLEGVSEGRQLDYKLILTGTADADKREFCADVSSLANTSGGHLVFGVDEDQGTPIAIPGLMGFDPDATKLRLEAILGSGVEPRLTGLSFKTIDMPGADPVMILEIPRSWQRPHLTRYSDSVRFYARRNSGKYIMDYSEIRAAFVQADQLRLGVAKWREDRIARIKSGCGCMPVMQHPKIVLHTVPLSAFELGFEVDLNRMIGRNDLLQPISASTPNRPNFDGVIAPVGTYEQQGGVMGYCQLFRDGRVELVDAGVMSGNGDPGLHSIEFEREAIDFLDRTVQLYRHLGVEYPVLVLMSLLDARGQKLLVHGIRSRVSPPPSFDRDDMLFPDYLLEEAPAQSGRVLRPLFDMVWQAAGLPASRNYDDNGDWTSTRRA